MTTNHTTETAKTEEQGAAERAIGRREMAAPSPKPRAVRKSKPKPPPTKAELLDKDLRRKVAEIAYNMEEFKYLIDEARELRIAETLGYASWTVYIADVIGKEMKTLPVDDRRQIVELLAVEGMSQRAIADAVGVSQKTVDRDLDQVSHHDSPRDVTVTLADGATREPGHITATIIRDTPTTVTGRDGKTYPARPKCPPEHKARKSTPGEAQRRTIREIVDALTAVAEAADGILAAGLDKDITPTCAGGLVDDLHAAASGTLANLEAVLLDRRDGRL